MDGKDDGRMRVPHLYFLPPLPFVAENALRQGLTKERDRGIERERGSEG